MRSKDGALLPHFIGVRNGGSDHLDRVQAGNEEVIRARFADAQFFYREDLKLKLEEWLPRLATLTFHEKLGSFAEVSKRLEALTRDLANETGSCAGDAEMAVLQRAAYLSKADMVTRIVTEFPYLAGTLGAIYAREQGEPADVTQCIEEHYLPAPGSRTVPASAAGRLLSMADKLDKLTGLFAIGVRPKGTADPYALRRDALGLLVLLLETGQRISLRRAIELAAAHLPVQADSDSLEQVAEFITRRLSVFLGEEWDRADVVAAAVTASGDDPVRCVDAVTTLSSWVARDDWESTLTAYARCVRLVRTQGGKSEDVDPGVFEHASEKALWQTVCAQREALGTDPGGAAIMTAMQTLTDPINAFFDGVMVMADDERVRSVRLGMLAAIAELTEGWADLSKLEGF